MGGPFAFVHRQLNGSRTSLPHSHRTLPKRGGVRPVNAVKENQMIHAVLDYVPANDCTNQTGSPGWRIHGWPYAAHPFGSSGLLHDVLEHFPEDPNPISAESELMAAGATLYLDLAGIRSTSFTWLQVVATAVYDAMETDRDVYGNLGELNSAPEVDTPADVVHIVGAAVRMAVGPALVEDYIGWICHGYNRAVERYAPYGGATAIRALYRTACDRIDARTPNSPNARLLLVLDPARGKVATRLYQH